MTADGRATRLAWGGASLVLPMVVELALLSAEHVTGLSFAGPLGFLLGGAAALVMGAAIIWIEKTRQSP